MTLPIDCLSLWLLAAGAFAGEAPPRKDVTPPIAPQQISGQVASEVRSNIFLVVFARSKEHPDFLPTHARAAFGFISATSLVYNIFLLKPEWGFRLAAASEHGELVKKTRVGERYGRNFGSLTGWDKQALGTVGRGTDPRRPYWTLAGPGFPPTRELPPLEQLFKFEKPGKYFVTLEVQVLSQKQAGSVTNAYPVRFPPVRLEVLKEPEPGN